MDWAANIRHGELMRAGVDERLEVDPTRMGFLFQGTSNLEYRGHACAAFPWRMGQRWRGKRAKLPGRGRHGGGKRNR